MSGFDAAGSGLGARALRGASWAYASYVFGRLLVLATTVVLARLLSAGEFGLVALALVFTALLETVKDLGIEVAPAHLEGLTRGQREGAAAERVEDRGEHARAVEGRGAQPVDRAVARDERCHAAVADDRVVAYSKFDKRPMPVPPIYQPEVAADAVHWAAHHKRREVYIGVPAVYSWWPTTPTRPGRRRRQAPM